MIRVKRDAPEARHIAERDERFGLLIDLIGDFEIERERDVFESLLRSIAGQQLSVSAADAVWRRFCAITPDISPEAVSKLSDCVLRQAGFSRPKIRYIRDLCEKVIGRQVLLSEIPSLSDEEVIRSLTRVKGIGLWTAQMLLIFNLHRPDVFSADDYGLRKAFGWLHALQSPPERDDLKAYAERWRPYGTTAALYLWRAINIGLTKDPVPF